MPDNMPDDEGSNEADVAEPTTLELLEQGRHVELFDRGLRCQNEGKYEEAARLLRCAADLGNTRAMIAFAQICRSGSKPRRDAAEALRMLRRAMENDDWNAKELFEDMYWRLEGVRRDLQNDGVNDRLAKAALSGDPTAALEVGRLYASTSIRSVEGHSVDGIRARHWLSKASEAENDQATFELAKLHLDFCAGKSLNGGCLASGPSTAVSIFVQAAERGHVPSMIEAARLFRTKDAADNEAAAYYWLARAGVAYLEGNGIEQNESKAMWLYSSASSPLLSEGDLNATKISELIDIHRKFADAGETGAMLDLARIFGDGDGVEVDSAESERWLEKHHSTSPRRSIH